MVTKEKVLATVNEMPGEFDLDELFERLMFIEKVEQGLRQLDEGKTISTEELLKEVKTWQK